MAKSTSEQGHFKNLANFQRIIDALKALGASYTPDNPAIAITALQTRYTDMEAAMQAVQVAKAHLDDKINIRQAAYKKAKSLAIRAVSAFDTAGASKALVDDAQSRLNRLHPSAPAPKPGPDGTTPATRSTSKRSYDGVADTYNSVITFLVENGYTTGIADIKPDKLQDAGNDLRLTTQAVNAAEFAQDNAIIARDFLFYNEETGTRELVRKIKKAIKSAFGNTSPQYRQINGIPFRSIGRRRGSAA